MKKTLLLLTISLSSAVHTQAANVAVTIDAATVEGFRTADDTLITNGTTLGILVLDVGGNGFNDVLNNSSIAVGSVINGDDLILNIVSSIAEDATFGTPAGIFGTANGSTSSLSITTDDSNFGKNFAVYWFPTLTTSSTKFTTGDTYGIARDDATWKLPGADGASTNTAGIPNAGRALFTVAVPEPSSTALLGLGALALIGRRQRR